LLRAGAEGIRRLEGGLAELERTVPDATEGDGRTASTTSLVQWFLTEGTSRPTGRRTPDQIVKRFREKVMGADAPERLQQAIALLRELAEVVAAPAVALERGAAIAARHGLAAEPLVQLRQVLAKLEAYDLTDVTVEVDLGLHRPLGYYTGAVFELYGGPAGPSLGGGGRYDGLVRALGGEDDVTALGFAYEVERLERFLSGVVDATVAEPVLLVAAPSEADFPAAVAEAQRLRRAGSAVELEVTPRTDAERAAYCQRRGLPRYLLVTASGASEVSVQGVPHYA
jgi:histidyl-tRNA synthetase